MANVGLGVGLAVGLGIPLSLLVILFAVTYGRRKHPKLPAPNLSGKSTTDNWLDLYHATRPRISHPPKPLV
ncbi:hypothetical protein NUH16_005230 [Penicillium rubens]|nr:hypothetical protein NUH16_005230 [Penicillium rubens]